MSAADNAAEAARHVHGATIAWGADSYLDLENPDSIAVSVEDYAYCLAYTVRWRGQTKTREGSRPFYGVGEHVVRGAEHLIREGYGAEHAFAFLFHESDEVPFGDFPGPAKKLPEVAPIIALAKRIGAAIDGNFGVQFPDPALLKRWDIRMLVTEKRDLLPSFAADNWKHDGDGQWTAGFEPFEERIIPYAHPELAARRFLELYRQLGGA